MAYWRGISRTRWKRNYQSSGGATLILQEPQLSILVGCIQTPVPTSVRKPGFSKAKNTLYRPHCYFRHRCVFYFAFSQVGGSSFIFLSNPAKDHSHTSQGCYLLGLLNPICSSLTINYSWEFAGAFYNASKFLHSDLGGRLTSEMPLSSVFRALYFCVV